MIRPTRMAGLASVFLASRPAAERWAAGAFTGGRTRNDSSPVKEMMSALPIENRWHCEDEASLVLAATVVQRAGVTGRRLTTAAHR